MTDRARTVLLPHWFELTCFALCFAQAIYLAASFVQGSWLVDSHGQPIAVDFVNVWASGWQAWHGNAEVAYDVVSHKAAEDAALGHGFEGQYPWNYPPPFLLVACLLALLPYVAAQIAWVVLTFPAYALVVRRIVDHRIGLQFACAFPAILANVMVGQNGFVTAALVGGSLLALQRKPVLAGCLIGLLSFKPHLGVLFPLVLVAGGHWRVIASASATVLGLIAASLIAFGSDPWEAFVSALPIASQTTLAHGLAEWGKLQSVYGLVRMLGGSEHVAWLLQGGLIVALVVSLVQLWRSKISFDLQAAALVIGILLSTPYLFLYDLVILATAIAFLLRAARSSGALAGEMPAILAACLLILLFPLLKVPVGLLAVVLIGIVLVRRLTASRVQAAGQETAISPAV